jgi:hypothetical protein
MTRVLALFAVLVATTAALRAQQPPPTAAPTTQVLATLTVNAGVDRAVIMKVMPDEVRDTVKLYLDGKIQQWYSRSDGRGVVFILNTTSAADAKALMDTLPLAKANLVTFDYMPLAPLGPLRMLLQP